MAQDTTEEETAPVTTTEPAPVSVEADEPIAEDKPKRGRPAGATKKSTAKKIRTVELTLTLTGTEDGEWQAELIHGAKRIVQGLPVPAAAVAKAAKELGGDISENIETVLAKAREKHLTRVAELEAELERARQALAELED
ncbi:hypothetical protein D5S17_31430 [Pseudonocardiaceae bacterium YIM PH 21723]|nr:hypothetical protein D5S17_31430 [Pseudonocardiaceae bacterium YIM PH 21723]